MQSPTAALLLVDAQASVCAGYVHTTDSCTGRLLYWPVLLIQLDGALASCSPH